MSGYKLLNDNFNQKYLKYRLKFYWQQVKELLFRYRLFVLFITLIVTTSLNNIKYIAYPIAGLLANSANNYFKTMSLVFIIATIFVIAKSQSEAIKGGAFRYYIECFYPKNAFSKLIDILLNIIALSIITILLVMARIYINQWFEADTQLLSIKFITLWVLLMSLQMNIICNNKVKVTLSIFALGLLTFGGALQSNEKYLVLPIFISSLLLFYNSELQLNPVNNTFATNIATILTRHIVKLFPSFTPQIGCMRANPNKFLSAYLVSFLISLLIVKLDALGVRASLIITMFTMQTFILSLLFITLAKNEIKYKTLYLSFSYKLREIRVQDLLFVSLGYIGTCVGLYFVNCLNVFSLLAGALTLIVSRYFLSYYRNAVVFILLASIFFNLLAVNI